MLVFLTLLFVFDTSTLDLSFESLSLCLFALLRGKCGSLAAFMPLQSEPRDGDLEGNKILIYNEIEGAG